MKKFIALLTAGLLAGVLSAQNQWPDIETYAELVMENAGMGKNWKKEEVQLKNPENNERYAGLEGNREYIDTALEAALAFYYLFSAEQAPAEAARILPANNPKQADRQLGALVFSKISVLRFLGNTADAGRHEAMLGFITGRGNVTRAEVEAFYRDGIAALVSGAVDAEFNKISFGLTNLPADRTYNSVLARGSNPAGWTIYYYRSSIENSNKKLTAPTLEALLAAMPKSGDFVQDDVNTVRAQTALMPAAKLSTAELAAVKGILTEFFLRPTASTYGALRDVRFVYGRLTGARSEHREVYLHVSSAYGSTLASFSRELLTKVDADVNRSNLVVRANSAEAVYKDLVAQK